MASENNIGTKLMMFTFLLNISVGLVSVLVIDIDGNPVFGAEEKGWLPEYSYEDTLGFQSSLNGSINPSAGNLENVGDQSYMVLDLFKVGFITRWLAAIQTYMFGIVTLLQYVFGNFLATGLHIFLFGSVSGVGFGALHSLIVGIYIYSAWKMWTN